MRSFAEKWFAGKLRKKISSSHKRLKRIPNGERKKSTPILCKIEEVRTLAAPIGKTQARSSCFNAPSMERTHSPPSSRRLQDIKNALKRIQKVGDLWKPILQDSIDLEKCVRNIRKKFKIS